MQIHLILCFNRGNGRNGRVASTYRTVSEPVVLVVAGVISIDLLVYEMKRVHERRDIAGRRTAKNEAGALTLFHLQESWDSEVR